MNLIFSFLTYFDAVDIVNVWDNVSKFIERQMALQKVSKFSRVLKFSLRARAMECFLHGELRAFIEVTRKFHYRYCRSL